jgi:hypothetical protein
MKFLPGLLLACALLFAVRPARADRVEDVARIHLEALGGRERIDALAAMRSTGTVIVGTKRVHFTLIAARPDRLRLETESGGRSLVQGTDGVEPPWEFDTGTWPPRYRAMTAATARVFAEDAEYDDPLVAGAARGFKFDFAGELEVGGRPMLRVLVTRNLRETYSLLLDADTYLIALRVEERTSPAGRPIRIVTRYEDYRPVDGVLLPHEISTATDGKLTQQTKVDQVTANPKFGPDTFSRPKIELDLKK